MRKKEATPSVPISHWEESWTDSDYKEHEQFFNGMLTEYRNILVLCNNDAITARLKWLEKNKAIKILKDHVLANVNSYAMYSAQFGKFCEWLSFQERNDPAYEVVRKLASEKISTKMKEIGIEKKKVDSETESWEKLIEEANDETKHEFNNMEVG